MRRIYLSFLIAAVLASFANAASFIVSPDGSSEYPTIQDAITAAAPGDSILLEDGVFSGVGNYEISFQGKDLILCSISGNPEDCIIDILGEANGVNEHGFFLNNRESLMSEIKDITIQGGDADGG